MVAIVADTADEPETKQSLADDAAEGCRIEVAHSEVSVVPEISGGGPDHHVTGFEFAEGTIQRGQRLTGRSERLAQDANARAGSPRHLRWVVKPVEVVQRRDANAAQQVDRAKTTHRRQHIEALKKSDARIGGNAQRKNAEIQ